MSHAAWRRDLNRRTAQSAVDRGYLYLLSRDYDAEDCIIDYLNLAERAGKPAIIATQPRKAVRIEITVPERRTLDDEAQEAIAAHCETFLRGSRAGRKTVRIDATEGQIDGIPADRAKPLCAWLAIVLADERSYCDSSKIVPFPTAAPVDFDPPGGAA